MASKIDANVGILKRAALLAVLCAMAALPMAAGAKTYTTLNWIQGSSDAYIRSGYTPKSTDKIEVTLSFVNRSSTYGIFCARGNPNTKDSFTLLLLGQKLRIDHGNTTTAQVTSTFTPTDNTKYVVVADGSTRELLVDGTSYATMHNESFTPGSEIIFLASWAAGQYVSNYATAVKLYGIRIWNASGTLMCDFVPATDGTKYGLFNRVGKTFHASAGTADITSYGEADDPETYTLNTWQGGDTTNPTDWGTAGNWSDGVPSAGDTLMIPSGVANMPVLTASTPMLDEVIVAGTLTMTNWTTCLNATTVTIPSGGILTSGAAVTNETDLSRVWINCTDLTIAYGGKIDVSYKGYAGHAAGTKQNGYGPGASILASVGGTGSALGTAPSHGGHGARLPNGSYILPISMPYDDPAAPTMPGSSGASSQWAAGRNGGGAVKIETTGTVRVDGQILADGQNALAYDKEGSSETEWSQDNHEQPGSGGSIFIECRTFVGSGVLSANGGGGCYPFVNNPSFPAGGGMIAVHYDADAQKSVSVAGMTISADAGHYRRYRKNHAASYISTHVDDKRDSRGIEAGMGTLHFTDESIAIQLAGKSLTGTVLGISEFTVDENWDFSGGRVRFGEEGVKVTVNGNLVFSGDDSRLEIGGGVTTNWDFMAVIYAGTVPSELTVTGDLTLGGVSRLDIRAAATNGTDRFGALVKVGGTMAISTNCFVYSWSDCQNLGAPHFEVGSLNVHTGGVFSAAFRGGRGTYDARYTSYGSDSIGAGPGGGVNAAGGSHGGCGGAGHGGAGVARPVYDDVLRPCMPGSGGGAYNTVWGVGGAGGGLVFVSATNGIIRVDGLIDARGRGSSDNPNGYGGGGSGGTIFLEAKRFFGDATGRLVADGGDTKPGSSVNSGSGGGGRIAVWCGAPWEPELSPSKLTVSTTPIADYPDSMCYLGSYSALAGPRIGDYGTDANIGEEGTVRFCYVPTPKGFVLMVR